MATTPTCLLAALSALAIGALALSGCTGPGGGADPEPGGLSSGQPGPEQSAQGDLEESPLEGYLTAIFGSSEVFTSGSAQEKEAFLTQEFERMAKTEELVAHCMAKEGFEYAPRTQNAHGALAGKAQTQVEWRPEDRDWVSRYGYGATNSPSSAEEMEEVPAPGEGARPQDPNEAYLQGLTEAEQQAYEVALYGEEPELDENGNRVYKWEEGGCWGRAEHEAEGAKPWESDEFKPLLEAVDAFYLAAAASPVYAEVDADWAACMAAAGENGFAKPSDAEKSIYELIASYFDGHRSDEGDEPDLRVGTMDDPAFARIAETEVQLALLDLDCREKTDYRRRHRTVQFALEQQFIADHREELEALRAAVEQA